MVGDLAGYTLAGWGFTPAQVQADVLLAYGEDDGLVPPAHGEWYRAQLPAAELQLWPAVGRLENSRDGRRPPRPGGPAAS